MRYRWAVLAAGTIAQTSFSALAIGLPVLVPTLREEYGLSLGQIGVLLGAEWVGALVTMLPWGIAADRFGERDRARARSRRLRGIPRRRRVRARLPLAHPAARTRRRGGRERELGQRARGHALVRGRRARACARRAADGGPARWAHRGARRPAADLARRCDSRHPVLRSCCARSAQSSASPSSGAGTARSTSSGRRRSREHCATAVSGVSHSGAASTSTPRSR